MLQRAPPWWYITAQSTSARAGPTVHLARVCGSSASRRQPGGEQLHRALLWRLDSDARYRAQKHVPDQALPDATHGHLVSQAPILGAHTKTALSSPKWGENRRFFCVLGASGASALVVGCWPPRWAGVCCDVLTRASEHDTLHHCRQPCCGPHPPLRLSLCAATAAEGKISWRQDVSDPSSCSGLPSPLQPHGAAATATGGGH